MKTKQSEAVYLIIKQRYWDKFSCKKTVDLEGLRDPREDHIKYS
jgi:hypothetical protein